MTPNPLTGEVAAEHRRDLLRHAADHRIAHETRAVRRHARANRLKVRVRPLRPGDAPLVAAIFDRLSPASRLARFLFPKRNLTAAELRYLTDIDHHDHEALIAVTRLRGKPIGVARFIRDVDDPTSAEIAVEVIDEWQNLGAGSMLAVRLAERARHENVRRFTALMSGDNGRSQRLLTKMGSVTHVTPDGTTVSYSVALPPPAQVPQQGHITPVVRVGRAS